MSKNFLSKKSWHTGSVKHMERVWKAEQKAADEQRKMAILKRELQEEQKQLELKKLQEQATGKAVSERLEWMYTIKKGPNTDEYLTGKTMAKAEEDKQLEQLRKTPGSLFMKDKANVVVDAQNKVRDDPLLMIKQQEQRQLKEILKNPVKMNKIKEAPDVKKALEKIEKKKKKEERKKEKKEKKEKKKKREQEQPEDGTKQEKSRSPSPASEDRKRSRSRSKSPVKRRSKSPPKDRSKSRSRSRSRSPRRHHDRRSRSRSPSRHHHHKRDRSRSRSRSPRKRSRSRSPPRHHHRHESTHDKSSNGHSHNGNHSNYRRDYKPKKSAEERAERLKQMMADGEAHEEQRWKRIKRADEETKQEEHEETTKDEHATFMMDMNKQVYTHHNDKLEDRMRRNIHLIQRNTGSSLSREES